jgi:hypothetical protein
VAEGGPQLPNVSRLQVVEEVGLVEFRGTSDSAHFADQPVRFQHALALRESMLQYKSNTQKSKKKNILILSE